MEISDECWDQVSPLLMNCTNEGNIGNASGNGASTHGGYGCSSEEVSFLNRSREGEFFFVYYRHVRHDFQVLFIIIHPA